MKRIAIKKEAFLPPFFVLITRLNLPYMNLCFFLSFVFFQEVLAKGHSYTSIF